MPVSSIQAFQKSSRATFSTRSGPTAQAKVTASAMAIASMTRNGARIERAVSTSIVIGSNSAERVEVAFSRQKSENHRFSRLFAPLTTLNSMILLDYC